MAANKNTKSHAHNVAIVTNDTALRGMLTVWLEDAGYSIVHPQSRLDANSGSVIYVTDTTPDSTSAPHTHPFSLLITHGTAPSFYLLCPVSRADFIAALASFNGAPTAVIRLDSRRKSIYVGGASIPLTSKEYAVMSFLFSRRGEPVSREEISKAANLDSSGANTADVYVCRLRKKLYPMLGSETIVTVRGKGYTLVI